MPPRIILMYDFLIDMGGIEYLMATHANMLKRAGYKVKLIFGDIDLKLANNEIFKGLELEEYGTSKISGVIKLCCNTLGINKLKEIIQKDDILISYSFPVNVAIRNFKNIKIDFINHLPNFLYLKLNERWHWASDIKRKTAFAYSLLFGSITKKIDKKIITKNSLIFTNSDYTKNKIDNIYDITSIVSYPPVSPDFTPTVNLDVLKKFNLPEKFIISSGRIESYKRYDLLIDSYSKIKNKNIPLIITGKWNEKEKNKLDRQIELLGLKDNVKFIGFILTEDLIVLFSKALAYVMSTPISDYGYVTAQAICCGCPIITWGDGGGSCEQTIDGVNGYTAKPYDISDFADKIDKCISENFKEKHKDDILNSAKPFTSDYQEEIFVNNIKKLLINKAHNPVIVR